MRIVHHSFPPLDKLYAGVCGHCGSLVEACESEATLMQQMSIYKGPPRRFVKCPNCSYNTVAIILEQGSAAEFLQRKEAEAKAAKVAAAEAAEPARKDAEAKAKVEADAKARGAAPTGPRR